MASDPPFIPRSLLPGAKKPQVPVTRSLPPPASSVAGPSAKPKQQQKGDSLSDEDIVLLYEMCLSDYAIWSDSALSDAMHTNNGHVSLRLLDKALAAVKRPEDGHVAKALRASSTMLDVRMLISQPDPNNWLGRGDKAETGGFELRRKDWPLVSLPALTQGDWNRRTLYVENLPQDSRSIVSAARLLRNLAPADISPSGPIVQNVEFPPHAQAKPDEIARCKGFAFVTFDSEERASGVLREWPWDKPSSLENATPAQHAAAKSGLRCMSLAHWEELKTEYLEYQGVLAQAASRPVAALGVQAATPSTSAESATAETLVAEGDDSVDLGFPRNRLVLVLDVPLDSTKPSLRTMFSQALDGEAGIDYIDFVKNVDRCHVRLTSSEHAHRLVAYFDGHAHGEVRAELVQGEREAMYWDKVPEKLRQAAMGATVIVDSEPPRKRQRKS